MKTYAGDLYLELPGGWKDDSQYVYRDEAADAMLLGRGSGVVGNFMGYLQDCLTSRPWLWLPLVLTLALATSSAEQAQRAGDEKLALALRTEVESSVAEYSDEQQNGFGFIVPVFLDTSGALLIAEGRIRGMIVRDTRAGDMKTYAGDLYLELPGGWKDDSQYVYRDEASDVEVRVERSPVGPPATPEELLELIVERLKTLGPLEDLRRGMVEVAGRQGATLSVRDKREGDVDTTVMEVLVFKSSQTLAITLTALAPASQQARLELVWRKLLASIKTVEVR